MRISGNIVDLVDSRIFPGTVVVSDGKIEEIIKEEGEFSTFIIPGLIDSHVHVESSMLVPAEFARLAFVHGTVATVSDPHEIANVMGIAGIDFMLDNASKTPFKFYFGASSCVPATAFETSGADFEADILEKLLKRKEIKYLSEMMNYPGVIGRDTKVMEKLAVAKSLGMPVDGHAPGLMGDDLKKYVSAGISTDHETYIYEEGLQKIELGMKVMIREGSAAKNFNDLHPLIGKYPKMCMFCSDDKHPDDLVKGHINEIVKRAFREGYDKLDVLRCASLNPVKHYGLDVGLLQVGDPADMVIVDNLDDFNVLQTYIDGKLMAENGKSLQPRVSVEAINNFKTGEKKASDFAVKGRGKMVNVIEAIDGQLVTRKVQLDSNLLLDGKFQNVENDLLKLAVVNRYRDVPPSVGFIRNFGLKNGAIATSFAHDSHNVVTVGTSDELMERAVNLVVKGRGGLATVIDDREEFLPLPVAGLMSDDDGYRVAEKYSQMTKAARENGSKLRAPFMTLSFMALLVIPELKLSDRGLFDGNKFEFVDVFND